ncbi:hypothetical protein L6164_026073 [Bauhinia variegata]|uniref:Uncharacterized protein n=1 Tax=Bauhinia variegata TaxID=167791 RepID=A0ACB9M3K2_BAUVA|nr:hypothetical protein L6164_026073 [Bauhinia variegata]
MALRLANFAIILLLLGTLCEAHLSSTFYDSSCPNALSTIRTVIRRAVSKERRMAASLIRLHFHDCFVQGCDASILLNDSATIQSGKTALPNLNSVRGFEVIDQAKTEVGKICPGVVSCADIVAVAARDSSFALSMIYNNASNIDAGFASTRRRGRPLASSTDNDKKLAALDLVTPNSFDNNYYKNLIQKKGLLASDQVLFNGGSADSIVTESSQNLTTFKSDFAAAMIKMGDIEPLIGSAGIIRKICSAVN